jgi:myosin heavy subunit
MKTYTKEEREAAMKALPRPIADFAKSEVITEIYFGLQKKHKLNIWELSVVAGAANLALLGLEPESSVEPTIHQELPEISNAVLRELIADINDRVFKEAKRRLKENIVIEEPWDEEEHGPKPTEEQMKALAERQKLEEKDDDNPEVLAADEKEVARLLKQNELDRKAAEDEYQALLAERARKATIAEKEAQMAGMPAPAAMPEIASAVIEKASIAERRLLGGAPATPKPTSVERADAPAQEKPAEKGGSVSGTDIVA